MDYINLEIAKQCLPYFIFQRIEFSHYREYFFQKIDHGYGYFLKRVIFRYPERYDLLQAQVLTPQINFEFFLKSYYKSRQVDPIPGRLLSTPSNHGVSGAAPLPVDNNIFSVCFTAGERKSYKRLDWLYPYSDTIEINITGQDAGMLSRTHQYVDIVLDGYLVPSQESKLWR